MKQLVLVVLTDRVRCIVHYGVRGNGTSQLIFCKVFDWLPFSVDQEGNARFDAGYF